MSGNVNVLKPFWYQRVITGIAYVSVGCLTLGSFLSAARNALALVDPITTYVGTIIVVASAAFAHLWLRRHPLPWVLQGQEINVKRLGVAPEVPPFAVPIAM